jgi:hypothetical protein
MNVEVIHRRLPDHSEAAEVVVTGDYCTVHLDCSTFEHATKLQDAIMRFAVDVNASVED